MVSIDINPSKPDRAWKAREFIAISPDQYVYRQQKGGICIPYMSINRCSTDNDRSHGMRLVEDGIWSRLSATFRSVGSDDSVVCVVTISLNEDTFSASNSSVLHGKSQSISKIVSWG